MSSDPVIESGRRVLLAGAEALTQMAEALDGPLGPVFAAAVETLRTRPGRVILTGVGKSGHVARKIAATLASTGTPALFVHATEASHGDLGMISTEDAVIALSRSGETRELSDVTAYCKRFGIPLIGITAVATSALGRASDYLLLLPPHTEATEGVDAPTTSTTLQIAMGDALAVALLEGRGFTAADFRVFHPGGKLGAMLRTVADLMHGPDELPLVDQATPMAEAVLTMSARRFGCVGVTGADGTLSGVITDGDLRRHMDGLMSLKAGDVMNPAPRTIAPDVLAGEALKLMNDSRITVLFVVRDRMPVGILHVHDVLRAGVI